ncbi:energy transducer TonB [Aurantiacibacter luteus]|uniref:TonB C-terminal domain-containing protein n=1 Tax=Aurantiacibacter luteus TaxID=1581420 RepID=A0A0G9N0Y4_9SPHN|nr:energy transducer TonB [Aurantiacibacter luteus]KLE35188.1 hypothetical protein AAW00_01535 [Aurantiacibacter luteus]
MSYANAVATPADRAKAAASVVAIHAGIGALLVTGLAVTGIIEKEDDGIIGIDLKDPLPPPPPPPEPIDQLPPTPTSPPVAAPLPPIPLNRPNPTFVELPRFDPGPTVPLANPPGPPIVVPPAPPAPPPTPAFTPTLASPRNGPTGWITNDDYPRRDLARENEGSARYRLVVGSNGRVDACEITSSTGHDGLDAATCRLIQSRARFDAATNAQGERVVGTYTGSVTWRIPE